jgi:hypothetical protein
VRIETDQQLHAVGSLARHRVLRVLRVLRDGPATVTQGAFEARLHALIDELTELSDPQEPAADLFVAFYRPQDMHNGEASK